jgi:hypothetical protein
MLSYFKATFHCSKLFHLTLFTAIYGYSQKKFVIFNYLTLSYFQLL